MWATAVIKHTVITIKIRPIWGGCYDHNFLRFLPNFWRKKCRFSLKNNVKIKILPNLAVF
jgi:hypothetical protein